MTPSTTWIKNRSGRCGAERVCRHNLYNVDTNSGQAADAHSETARGSDRTSFRLGHGRISSSLCLDIDVSYLLSIV